MGIHIPIAVIRVYILKQDGTAIMTAGTYQNFFEENGQAYSHILNPKTGRPITRHLLLVTVVHNDSTWADPFVQHLLSASILTVHA
jgi:thiamine biosynthesis lipoprotein